MSRATRILTILIAVFAAIAFVRYVTRDRTNGGHATERVRVVPPGGPEDVLVEIQRSRRMESRITSDVRDAWTQPVHGTSSFEVPIARRGNVVIATAFTISSTEPIPAGNITYALELLSDDRSLLRVNASSTLADAAAQWNSFRLPTRIEESAARLVFTCDVAPADGVTLAPGQLKACWSVPEITGERLDGPNLLVISIDTLRADRLGCYGYARGTSPNLDKFLARGAVFEHAISAAPWTLPSYASLFTGLYPASHRAGVVTGREKLWGRDEIAQGKGQKISETLRADVPTLAALLKDAGWRTAAFYNNPFIDPVRKIDRGFEQYTGYQYNASSGVDLAQKWIDAHSSSRWFLFLHLIDPHHPYAPPAPYDERFAGLSVEPIPDWLPDRAALVAGPVGAETKKHLSDLYDGEIAFADAQLGRLFDALEKSGELARTLVVFHSDHGEEFWEHGGFEHGHALHEELLRVPLAIVFPPRLNGGMRIPSRVRTVDVFPTVLELLGLPVPEKIDGQSLLPLFDTEAPEARDALSEGILWGDREIKSYARSTLKLVASGSADDRLFDFERDPEERENVAAVPTYAEPVKAIRALLEERHARTQAIVPSKGPGELTAEDIQRLKNLGYLGEDDE